MNSPARAFTGEFLGTFLMCFFGIGAVATAVMAGAHTGPFQVGMVWGITIAIAIYATRNLSCAHFNPAVSIAMCVAKRLPWKELPIYLIGQCLGAFVAALILFIYFEPTLATLAALPDGEVSAKGATWASAITVWAEPYPNNPGLTVGVLQGALGEGIMLCLLLIIIFSMTEDANVGKPGDVIFPLFIGFTITMGICTVGPMTDAGFNPARDIMPRIVALFAGADPAQIFEPGVWVVYVIAPIIGGIVGALLWMAWLEPLHANKVEAAPKN